jgi:Ca2+-binding RTX toxin-like protein
VGTRAAIALLVTGILAITAGTADASMQISLFTGHSSTRTFRDLRAINSTTEADVASVGQSGTDVVINDSVGISTFPADCHRLLATAVACPLSGYDDVSFFTGPGNDVVTSEFPSYPNLTIDQIAGPDVAVFVNATLGRGRDRFQGGKGTDAAAGGPGRDRMVGGDGNDLFNGNAGDDRIFGGDGTDELFGNAGRDRLVAGPGVPDYMLAGKGRDTCLAHEGRDRVGSCERVRLR